VAAADKKPADRTKIELDVLAWLVPQVQQTESEETVVLVNSEVTDKLLIVILSWVLVCAYSFGSGCNSAGVIAEPHGATG
jgi:hypothetical protein